MLHAVQRDLESPARIVCFLAHLAVEKALKATLIDAAVPFAKTHDLVALYDRRQDAGRLADVERSKLALLSSWGVDGRYADDLHDADRALGAEFTSFADHLVALVQAEVTASG